MKLSTDFIRTTHAGSLPRPSSLLASDDLRAAVAAIVRRQFDAGIDAVNDGDLARPDFSSYVLSRLSGFAGAAAVVRSGTGGLGPRRSGLRASETCASLACVGEIGYIGAPRLQAEIANLHAALVCSSGQEAFVSAPSPGAVAYSHPNCHYADRERYLAAIAAAMKREYDAIHAAGLVLQLDCPDLVADDLGEEDRRLSIAALNDVTRDIPAAEMRMRLSCCDSGAADHRELPLCDVIRVVIAARPGALYLEAANPRRGHEWRVFESVRLPEDKTLIVGVVDPTSRYVEHPRLVADRIVRYARLVGRERVIAATDGGFPTDACERLAWAKLDAVAEGALIATGELW